MHGYHPSHQTGRSDQLAAKKAILISNKFPFPANDGKKTVLVGFLHYLTDRFGNDNVTYVVIGKQDQASMPAMPCKTIWISPPRRLSQVWHLLTNIVNPRGKSLQESITFSAAIQTKLDRLVRETTPALLLFDTLRIGQYFESKTYTGCQRILYMDDLFYLRFRRMLDVSATQGAALDVTGTFSAFLPRFAQAFLRIGFLRDTFLRIEINRVERRELSSPALYDRCLLINPNEVELLKTRSRNNNVYPVKPVLALNPCPRPRNYQGAPVFLMFGSLRHPVYRASVIHFLNVAMKETVRSLPSAKIIIIGDGADSEVEGLCNLYRDNIELAGFVENIDSLFSSACALLVPLLTAGGLKLKTLTALYYGLPIIATDNGVDGIPLQDTLDFIRENDITRFPIHMRKLCDVQFNKTLSENTSKAFVGNYAKERVYEEYDDLFGINHGKLFTLPRDA